MNKLLKRIEKLETLTERLEQSIVEIRNSCPCLAEDIDEGEFNCEPGCERCEQHYCICDDLPEEEPEEPEHECEDGCPSCRSSCEDFDEPEIDEEEKDHETENHD